MVGRNSGWSSLTFVFIFTKLFKYDHNPHQNSLFFIDKLDFQDDFPLASLPLLGYNVDTPAPSDNISKDYVFKLQFKNHVYFFRAESQFTFDR